MKIGIAWRSDTDSEFYTNTVLAVREAGAIPVLLDQVIDYDLEYENGLVCAKGTTEEGFLNTEYAERIKKNRYHNSNAAGVTAEVDAVIFTGGEGISPTLFKEPQKWNGIREPNAFHATRDVSDYLLMAYCIDEDLPVLAFCRGNQMLAVVSGASIIQNISVYFEENQIPYYDEHRNQVNEPGDYRDYAPHDIEIIDRESLVYQIFECDVVEAVPSWHRQAIGSVEGTQLKITAVHDTNGYEIIEGTERTDCRCITGYQFHPEASVAKHLYAAENADLFMDQEMALKIFQHFVEYIKSKKENRKRIEQDHR